MEVFGNNPVSSREFPALVFDAAGTLIHFMPSLQKFFSDELNQLQIETNLELVENAFVQSSSQLIREAEKNLDFECPTETRWARILQNLNVDEKRIPEILNILKDRLSLRVKIVIADSSIQVLEQLKDRGYQLAASANWDIGLGQVFKQNGILDLFEVILTSDEVGRAKPHPEFFETIERDLDVPREQIVSIGDSFFEDVLGPQRRGWKALLYDPDQKELKSMLSEEELAEMAKEKVVSIEILKQMKRAQSVRHIHRFAELLDIFR